MMTPADFPEIMRDACVTDAPNSASFQAAIIRLSVVHSFERDWGESVHLRRGIDLILGKYKWEQAHAS